MYDHVLANPMIERRRGRRRGRRSCVRKCQHTAHSIYGRISSPLPLLPPLLLTGSPRPMSDHVMLRNSDRRIRREASLESHPPRRRPRLGRQRCGFREDVVGHIVGREDEGGIILHSNVHIPPRRLGGAGTVQTRTESKESGERRERRESDVCVLVIAHSTQYYAVHSTQYTVHSTQYTVNSTQ